MSPQTKAKQAKIARLLEFCAGGKTSLEMTEELGVPESSLGNLRLELLKSGHLYKVIHDSVKHFKGSGPAPCYFVTTGTECNRPPPVIAPKETPDPKWNHDFIKVAHRVLVLGAA